MLCTGLIFWLELHTFGVAGAVFEVYWVFDGFYSGCNVDYEGYVTFEVFFILSNITIGGAYCFIGSKAWDVINDKFGIFLKLSYITRGGNYPYDECVNVGNCWVDWIYRD